MYNRALATIIQPSFYAKHTRLVHVLLYRLYQYLARRKAIICAFPWLATSSSGHKEGLRKDTLPARLMPLRIPETEPRAAGISYSFAPQGTPSCTMTR